jgi:hypothetical protein
MKRFIEAYGLLLMCAGNPKLERREWRQAAQNAGQGELKDRIPGADDDRDWSCWKDELAFID